MGRYELRGKGLGWREQRRQTKHSAPALNQVLYFPEVMAKERKGEGEMRKTERARKWEGERGQ